MNFARGTDPSAKPWWKKTDWMKTKKGMAFIAVFLIFLGSAAAYFSAPDTAVPASDNNTSTKDDESKVDEDVSEGEDSQPDEDSEDSEATTPPPSTVKPPPAAPPPPPSVTPGTEEVTMQGNSFQPQILTVKRGTTVTWVNNDNTNHDITPDSTGGPSSSTLAPDEEYSFTFNVVGSYPYHCSIHGISMSGTVNVTE